MSTPISLSCPGSAGLSGMASPSRAPRLDDLPTGPFRASQIRDGDPYELSNGHPVGYGVMV